MKVTTDSCLFGAWVADQVRHRHGNSAHLLDVGTGTGLLSLMVAQQCSAKIDAIEIDDAAFQQATENITGSPWQARIQLLHGDVTSFPFIAKYDCIFSNPPFYEGELQSPHRIKNIAHHQDGLLLEQLIQFISHQLTSNGDFFLLLPFKRYQEIAAAMEKSNLHIVQTVFVRQSVNHDFFRAMIHGSLQANLAPGTTTTEIAIRDDKQGYTPAFTRLLVAYYLYL